jgi:hypothetical protein
MAYETGTADDYVDLLDRLHTFVTLTIPVGERWIAERYDTGGPVELILKGPGSGSDEIFVGIKSIADGVGDYQNWKIGGMTGYLDAEIFENQPGYSGDSPSPIHLTLWNSSIPYWFIANGRRIIAVAKISTRYVWTYLGYPNAYASPGQYAYPLIVSGNLAWGNATPPAVTSADWRWSYTGIENSNPAHAFWNSGFVPGGGYTRRGQLRIRTAAGAWRDCWAGWGSSYAPDTLTPISQLHYNSSGSITTWRGIPEVAGSIGAIWPALTNLDAMEAAIDGSYVLLPIILMAGASSGEGPDLFGELEGVHQVTGGLSAEDIIEIGSDDYLMVPNVFRSNRQDFVAIKLA